jgi:CheY-like chemotaxis protein
MPWLAVDPQRIRQIAFNLVGNAVKFTHEGHVEVRASLERPAGAPSGTLRLTVEDTGCGISEEDLARIGSAYVQVGSKMSRNGGTGLGLAICKQLAAAMGGRIDVESELGKGSTFTVTIPGVKVVESEVGENSSSSRKDAGIHTPTQNSNSNSHLRILIVDDSKMNIMVLKAQLKNLGQFEVASAGDGQEALELLRSRGAKSFDLVLTDMWMPMLDGSGLIKAIRADPALSGMRVVVVTADVEFRAKFAEDGFDDILLKPVTRDNLVELLAKEAR